MFLYPAQEGPKHVFIPSAYSFQVSYSTYYEILTNVIFLKAKFLKEPYHPLDILVSSYNAIYYLAKCNGFKPIQVTQYYYNKMEAYSQFLQP